MTVHTIDIGDSLPRLEVQTDLGPISLEEYRGHHLLLYFYPKDDTPGCTIESQDFSRLHDEFLLADTQVLGVSRDALSSHQRFINKYDLSVTLVADTQSVLCDRFGVIKEKNMYGKTVRGIERSSFLFDRTGILRRVWRGLSVTGHAQEALEAARSLP
ncbi:MAG: bacterioferritin comigratory protein [Pseudomonadota bacterium]|jgi:peroxiredoxin Q/BCP